MDGMQTLEKALTELVAEGAVDLDQARLVSLYPKEVEAPPPPPPAEDEKRRRRRS
jgi:Tfp pilus assembly pilus retraction ATPase PilT